MEVVELHADGKRVIVYKGIRIEMYPRLHCARCLLPWCTHITDAFVALEFPSSLNECRTQSFFMDEVHFYLEPAIVKFQHGLLGAEVNSSNEVDLDSIVTEVYLERP